MLMTHVNGMSGIASILASAAGVPALMAAATVSWHSGNKDISVTGLSDSHVQLRVGAALQQERLQLGSCRILAFSMPLPLA